MKILSDLPRNAKYSIMCEPLWALFGGMIFFYAPLYMKEMGLSEIQMGTINTINLFVSFICHFFAGPVANRLGRKKTTLVFDLISWSIPMFMWAIAQNFWYFLAAAIINAFVKIVVVSWYCLISEDTHESKRAKVFGIIYIINSASGIFTPVTGLFIEKYGTVPTMRVLYSMGLVSMTVMFFLRNHFVTETEAGKDLMAKHSSMSLVESLKSYIKTVAGFYKNKQFILISLIYIITSFIMSMNFFQVIYLKEYLGFSEKQLSYSPGISALLCTALYMLVVPRLKKDSEGKILTGALAICAFGSLIFLIIPRGNLPVLLATTSILAIGNFAMQTYRDSVFMNKMGSHEKADMFGAVQTITTLICIPSGYIAGLAYSISPLMPFIAIFILFIATIAVSASLSN